MQPETLTRAVREAGRFMELAGQVKIAETKDSTYTYIESGPKITGALRRASMDLTRALAEMRKP